MFAAVLVSWKTMMGISYVHAALALSILGTLVHLAMSTRCPPFLTLPSAWGHILIVSHNIVTPISHNIKSE